MNIHDHHIVNKYSIIYVFVISSFFQVEFVDMHFGTGPGNGDAFVDLDPYILDEHLSEIEVCCRVSKSVFFLVSSVSSLCLNMYRLTKEREC